MRIRGAFPSRTGLTRKLAILATPLIIQQMSYTLLGVADTFFVSRVSTQALAATGLAGILFFAIALLFRGPANSSVVFVGRAHGAGDDEAVGTWVWCCLVVVGIMSAVSLALPWFFRWGFPFLAPGDETQVAILGANYLFIRGFELPFFLFSGVVWGFMVGRGDSRTPMILAWITVLLNIALDWLLVLGNLGFPRLEVTGAAIATVIAHAVNAGLSAIILWAPSIRRRYKTHQRRATNRRDIFQVFRIGLPMGFGDFAEIASFTVFFSIIGHISTGALAANQIALQYMSISFMVGIAFAMATASMVAQQLGAKRPDLAQGVGYRGTVLGMIAMGLIGFSFLIAPAALMSLFTGDPDVIKAGVQILRLMAIFQLFDAVAIVLSGALNGSGDTTFTMMARVIIGWVLFLPLVALIVFGLDGGVRDAWIGAIIYGLCLALVYLIRFQSGRWQKIKVL
jgi:MATE family multidrug resistance protein